VKKLFFCVTFLLLSITSFSACGRGNADINVYEEQNEASYKVAETPTAPPTPMEFSVITLSDVLQIAMARREGIIMPDHEYLTELTEGRVRQELDLSRFEALPDLPQIESRPDGAITFDEAVYEVNLFFEILRQFYGAYIFFGGDDVFFPVRDGIIERFAVYDYLFTGLVYWVFHNGLNEILNDNHFRIFNSSMVNEYEFYAPFADLRFGKSERGFYSRESGRYVVDISEGGFRLSLSHDGVFYYSPVIIRPFDEDGEIFIYVPIVYDDGEETVYRFAQMRPPTGARFADSGLAFHDGIPVVTVREMGWPFSTGEHTGGNCRETARDFLRIAPELRDEPVIIIDIRQNMGGNGSLGADWLLILTEEFVPFNFRAVSAANEKTGLFVNVFGGEDIFYYAQYFMDYFGIDMYGIYEAGLVEGEWLDENTWAYGYLLDRIVHNEQLLIFLTDRVTASAAEIFADLAFNMENTLVVGQNTSGTLLTNVTVSGLMLPYSGLQFQFGGGMYVFPKGHLPEGIGLAPDVWVRGDALTAVLAMLGGLA